MKIQLKRSNVLDGGLAKQPTAAQMEYGELAVNYSDTDPVLFIKDSNDAIVRIAGAGSSGSFDGDYNNLTNKPTIGDGTLTINNSDGSEAGAFTANQAGDTTISLPAGFSGDYDDLSNLPTIGDGTLTINNSDGSEAGAFTANQVGPTTISLPAGFSGDYNDLSNLPTIGDGTLTINDSAGNEVGVFTANQVGATTVSLPAAPAALVSSVNTQIGDVVLTATDVGALAPGDDISELVNDVGYITSADVGAFWENDTSASDIKNLDSITKVNVNGAVHTNANLDINSGNHSIRLFPTDNNAGSYTLVGANNAYGTFSIGTATTSGSTPWNLLVRFMVDANGKTIVGNDDPNGPPVAAANAELTVIGGVNSKFGTDTAQLGNVAPLNDWSCYPALA